MKPMRIDAWHLLAALALLICGAPSHAAAESSGGDAVRQRVAQMQSAMNALDLEGVLGTLDPDVVVTWQHGGVARGHQSVRDYWQRVLGGSDPLIRRFSTSEVVASQTVLHGRDTAVAFGVIRDRYVLKGDVGLDLDVYWSATALRREAGWKFISVHFSNNTFDNAVLDKMKMLGWYVAVGSIVAGAAAMWLFVRVRTKSKLKGE